MDRHVHLDALDEPLKPPVLIASTKSADLMIVGVIGDTKNGGVADATRPAIYLPYTMIAPPDRSRCNSNCRAAAGNGKRCA
jgi:hypothetical protein